MEVTCGEGTISSWTIESPDTVTYEGQIAMKAGEKLHIQSIGNDFLFTAKGPRGAMKRQAIFRRKKAKGDA